MPEIAQATITVTPVLQGAQQTITNELNNAAGAAGEQAGEKSGSKFSGSFTKSLLKGTVAVAGAVAGAGAAMVGAASKTAEYGDQIDKASQKLGVSAEFYQEWNAVLQHSGTSMDSMSATFKKLATASQDASADQQAAFESLGLSMEQVSSMSAEDLFANVVSGLQSMEEGTERTALATTLLGKGAMEMGALLNTSSEDTQAMIDRVHELGGVMSGDAVKDSAAFKDSLMDMKASFSGLSNGILVEMLPSLTGFMDKISDFVANADLSPITDTIGGAVSAIGDFISQLDIEAVGTVFQNIVAGIGDAVGLAWNVIQRVAGSISGAFSKISGALSSTGTSWSDVWGGITDAVGVAADLIGEAIGAIAEVISWLVTEAQTDGTFINTVWENITTKIDTAVSVIKGLIDMVTAILHGDWTAAWEAAQNIVDTVLDAIEKVCTNTWEFIKGAARTAWEAIKNAVTTPIESAKTMLTNVWNTVKSTITNIWNGIKALATSVWNGIKTAVMNPINSVKSLLSGAWSSIRSSASSAWNSVKSAITGPIESARSTISSIVSRVKGMFPIRLGNIFSGIKLPHFNISGGVAPWGIGGMGTRPSISISWYKKAEENPYLFTNPTIFGAGEGRDEILYGRDALMRDIREATGRGMTVNNYITVNGAEEPEAWANRFARQMKLEARLA